MFGAGILFWKTSRDIVYIVSGDSDSGAGTCFLRIAQESTLYFLVYKSLDIY